MRIIVLLLCYASLYARCLCSKIALCVWFDARVGFFIAYTVWRALASTPALPRGLTIRGTCVPKIMPAKINYAKFGCSSSARNVTSRTTVGWHKKGLAVFVCTGSAGRGTCLEKLQHTKLIKVSAPTQLRANS